MGEPIAGPAGAAGGKVVAGAAKRASERLDDILSIDAEVVEQRLIEVEKVRQGHALGVFGAQVPDPGIKRLEGRERRSGLVRPLVEKRRVSHDTFSKIWFGAPAGEEGRKAISITDAD
jgi:hypothetical protein